MYDQNEMKCGSEIWLNILSGRYMLYFHSCSIAKID
jgi:hypothetical protein